MTGTMHASVVRKKILFVLKDPRELLQRIYGNKEKGISKQTWGLQARLIKGVKLK